MDTTVISTKIHLRALTSKRLAEVLTALNQEYRKTVVRSKAGDFGDRDCDAQFACTALSKAAECVFAAKDALDEFESNR